MSRTFTELAAIFALVGLGGTAWNYHNRNDDTKFLPWIAGQRPAPCLAKGTPAPTPDAKAPGLAPAPGTDPSAPGKAEGPSHDNGAWGFAFIDHAEAVAHFNDGVTFFIDARRTKEYEEGHITGAISISPWEADHDRKIAALRENPEVNPEAPIVVYCTASEDCTDSRDVANYLKNAGFRNIVIYEGGFPRWQREHKDSPQYITKGAEPGVRP